jgi:hypothetical protein
MNFVSNNVKLFCPLCKIDQKTIVNLTLQAVQGGSKISMIV